MIQMQIHKKRRKYVEVAKTTYANWKKEYMLAGCTEAQVQTIILPLESLNNNADIL